jgi:hypothetical protein
MGMEMNHRERVLAILRGGQPGRVPWLGDLTYWATALEARGKAPKNFQSLPEYYDWHRDLGVGFYLQGYEPFKAIHDVTVKFKRDGRCVLGVADQVPPDALESRVRRVAELVDQYGIY